SLIAQLVEQSAVNRSVVGSSPTQGASLAKTPFTNVNGVLPYNIKIT
ncbi:MAG: hypothetical protein K0R78_3825, partial [Pelosinus sp.]|nr:hypothetical protein [Pelosinus sp.]